MVKEETGARQGRPGGLTAFFHHLHPRMVRKRSATFGATLGLGMATVVCMAIATLSGLLLMLYYVPSVELAHASVQDIISVVPLGSLMRNLHRWSAHATVACCVLHLLRTLLWGSFCGAHRRVWLVGVGLLLVTLATSFSGYLLPWDQDAYWTVTVGTSLAGSIPWIGEGIQRLLLGGDAVGQPTLTRFFFLHVLALPGLGALLLVIHLFRLRRAGGLARPPDADGAREALVPADALISRELAITIAITAALVILSALADARLGPAPDLMRPDNPPKAPWFLVGFQEMVSYSAIVGGFVFPGLLFLTLALGPWLDGSARCEGKILPGKLQRALVGVTLVVAAVTTLLAVRWWGDPQLGAASWLNPAAIAVLALLPVPAGAWLIARQRAVAYRALVIGLLAATVLFTAVGWFWRGPDWALEYHPGPGHGVEAAAPAPRRAGP